MVKWIKITTNMFDDEKIKLIRKLPESDSILLTWIQLLVQAGKANASGSIVLSETIPYTDEMLATIFDRPINIIRLALNTFHQFGMIDMEGGVISISNWDKHQNLDGLDKIREQERLRKQKQRAKQKLLPSPDMSRDSHGTVTQSHATDIEEDKEIEIEIDKEKKKKYADFVQLYTSEYDQLIEKLGNEKALDMIEALSLWKGSKGKKTKSDYLTILNWVRKETKENNNEPSKRNNESLYKGYDFGF